MLGLGQLLNRAWLIVFVKNRLETSGKTRRQRECHQSKGLLSATMGQHSHYAPLYNSYPSSANQQFQVIFNHIALKSLQWVGINQISRGMHLILWFLCLLVSVVPSIGISLILCRHYRQIHCHSKIFENIWRRRDFKKTRNIIFIVGVQLIVGIFLLELNTIATYSAGAIFQLYRQSHWIDLGNCVIPKFRSTIEIHLPKDVVLDFAVVYARGRKIGLVRTFLNLINNSSSLNRGSHGGIWISNLK